MSAERWFKKMKSERIRLIDRACAIERFLEAVPALSRELGNNIPEGVVASLVYQSRFLAETLGKQIDDMADAERKGIILRANPDRPNWFPLKELPAPPDDEDCAAAPTE